MKNYGAKDALRLKSRRRYANRLNDLGAHDDIERRKRIEAFYRRQRNGARAALSKEKDQ